MHETEDSYKRSLRIANAVHAAGWKWLGGVRFAAPSNSIHDLSAADLTKLDDIEQKGLFLCD